jgi:hypothetical protein
MKKKKKSASRKAKSVSKKKIVHKIKRVIRRGAERAGHPLKDETCAKMAEQLASKRPSKQNLVKEFREINLAFGGHPTIPQSVDFSDLDIHIGPIRHLAVDFSDLNRELDPPVNPQA